MDYAKQNNLIRWDYVSAAIEYYKKCGFTYLEVPWIVSDKALKVTLPKDKTGISTQYGPLVGSAEQSFIQLMINGTLKEGKYVAATPCFRDDEEDEWHQKYFFKVELIQYFDDWKLISAQDNTLKILETAFDFFRSFGDKTKFMKYEKTKDGYDILLNNIELGSYGFRCFNEKHWIYGTGLAEPRFSKVLENI